MSLLGTLAKVAIGIAVAKGVGGMMKGARAPQSQPRSKPGGGGLLEDILSQQTGGSRGGAGLEDLLGSVLGGNGRGRSGQRGGGGLGDLLEQLGGQGRSSGGGLGDILGQLGGGGQSGNAEPLGDLFEDFISGGPKGKANDKSFGDIFNESLQRRGEPQTAPSAEQEMMAGLMLRAMIQAAKSDGEIDPAEPEKLVDNLEDATREEIDFVNRELSRPVDVDGLIRQVPRGLEQQVYMMSVMGIDLDNRNEAEYLHKLASGLDIGPKEVNAIHNHLGVPDLYS